MVTAVRRTAGAAFLALAGPRAEERQSVIKAGNPGFPSGVVQRERRLGVEAWGLFVRFVAEAGLRASVHDLDHIGHESGRQGTFWTFEAGLRVRHDFAQGTR